MHVQLFLCWKEIISKCILKYYSDGAMILADLLGGSCKQAKLGNLKSGEAGVVERESAGSLRSNGPSTLHLHYNRAKYNRQTGKLLIYIQVSNYIFIVLQKKSIFTCKNND